MKKILLFLFIHIWFTGYGQTKLDTSQLPMTEIINRVGVSGWGVSGWGLTGTSGTTAGTNFIGTIDSIDLVLKTNDTERAKIAANGTLSITKDIVVNSLMFGLGKNSIASNMVLGLNPLQSNISGHSNMAIGGGSMFLNTTGYRNMAIGAYSLYANTIGNDNTIIGFTSGRHIVSGVGNTMIGSEAGYNITSSNNIIIGKGRTGITTGGNNTIIGSNITALSSALSNNIILADGAGNQRINVDANGYIKITNPPSGADTDSLVTVDASGNLRKRTVIDVINNNSITANTTFTASIAAGGEGTVNATMTGVVVGDVVHYTLGAADLPTGIVVKSIRVSAANTVVLTLSNTTAGALSPNVTVYFKKQ